ncbi:MAG TPA: SCP2 sterol-binding domain-containing protein [Tahibacter sp.]|nr:SCP2 sterol-binding domain-containing protein [Tahibacter sp.]
MSASSLLRLLPPPRRWAPLLPLLPRPLLARAFERAATQALAGALQRGELAALENRVLGIETVDLPLRFAVRVQAGRLRIDAVDADDPAVQARVRATLTDLLLLSSRLEDADTLFFQRRLGVVGDTELVLTARNLLDRLDWEQVPLALRIVLNRAAHLADTARTAWRAGRERMNRRRA